MPNLLSLNYKEFQVNYFLLRQKYLQVLFGIWLGKKILACWACCKVLETVSKWRISFTGKYQKKLSLKIICKRQSIIVLITMYLSIYVIGIIYNGLILKWGKSPFEWFNDDDSTTLKRLLPNLIHWRKKPKKCLTNTIFL